MSRDLMRTEEIKAFVRDAYRAVNGATTRVAERLYSAEELAQVPESARSGALGVVDEPVEVVPQLPDGLGAADHATGSRSMSLASA